MMDFPSVHPALGRKGAHSALSVELGEACVLFCFVFFNYYVYVSGS